jgi:hypothetical protein
MSRNRITVLIYHRHKLLDVYKHVWGSDGVNMKIIAYWDVTTFCLVEVQNRNVRWAKQQGSRVFFDPEDRDNILLRNVDKLLQYYKMSHPRR